MTVNKPTNKRRNKPTDKPANELRNKPTNKPTNRCWFAALALALAMSQLSPMTVWAIEKPESMDEAQWEKLQDNVLEYDELAGRVEYFNPTVRQIVDQINDSYDTVKENIRDYQETADDFIYLQEVAMKEMDFTSAYMYQINRKILRTMSSQMIKQEKKRDTTIERSTRQARKGLTSGCQQLMLAYNKMAVNKATLEKQVELYSQMAAMYETQAQIGMATQTQILSAQASRDTAQSSLTSLSDQMESVKSSLLQLAGWDFDSDVTIGTIPAADVSQIEAIDFAADKAIAPKNNYTIINMQNASPKDADNDGKYENKDYRAKELGLEQAMQQLSITIDNLYQTLFEKQAALAAAQTAFDAAQLKWDGALRKYQLGMLGQAEYLGEELSYCAAQAAYQSADLDMTQALLNYYWGVNGLGELTE